MTRTELATGGLRLLAVWTAVTALASAPPVLAQLAMLLSSSSAIPDRLTIATLWVGAPIVRLLLAALVWSESRRIAARLWGSHSASEHSAAIAPRPIAIVLLFCFGVALIASALPE